LREGASLKDVCGVEHSRVVTSVKSVLNFNSSLSSSENLLDSAYYFALSRMCARASGSAVESSQPEHASVEHNETTVREEEQAESQAQIGANSNHVSAGDV